MAPPAEVALPELELELEGAPEDEDLGADAEGVLATEGEASTWACARPAVMRMKASMGKASSVRVCALRTEDGEGIAQHTSTKKAEGTRTASRVRHRDYRAIERVHRVQVAEYFEASVALNSAIEREQDAKSGGNEN